MTDAISGTNKCSQAKFERNPGKKVDLDSESLRKLAEILKKKLLGDEKRYNSEEIGSDCFEKTTNEDSEKPKIHEINKLMSSFDAILW